MNKEIFVLVFAAFLVPGAAAQSAFEGTWKLDFNRTNFGEKQDEFLLQDGVYTCKTCAVLDPLRADGSDQPYAGFPNADTVAVKVDNEFQIEFIGKKGGAIVGQTTLTVTPDGQTLASQSEFNNPQSEPGIPIRETKAWTRVSNGPPGSHAISGSWRGKKMGVSDGGDSFTYRINGNEITLIKPFGHGFTAKLDGSDAPYNGDKSISSVQVRLIDASTLEETDLRDEKILRVTRMTVAPDGRSATIVTEDKRQDSTSTAKAVKQ